MSEVRKEMLAQRAAQNEALMEQVGHLRQDVMSQHAAQNRLFAEQAASLRREISRSVREERDARLGDFHELRAAVTTLQERARESAGKAVEWTPARSSDATMTPNQSASCAGTQAPSDFEASA